MNRPVAADPPQAPGPTAAEQLIVFVRAPRPGTVKTRLALALGPAAACAAYRTLVDTLLRRLAGLPNLTLRFTPDDAHAEIADWLAPGWRAQAQGAGDLGARLHAAFASAFDAGARRVAAIGSDCPELTEGDVREAWRALRGHDVVVGPATDGGYWLIGLREARPELFAGVDWGTSRVLEQTLALARAHGLRVHRLRERRDVDTAEDWRAFLARASDPLLTAAAPAPAADVAG
jgi:rSAM/selenodomain-associated transferase 1